MNFSTPICHCERNEVERGNPCALGFGIYMSFGISRFLRHFFRTSLQISKRLKRLVTGETGVTGKIGSLMHHSDISDYLANNCLSKLNTLLEARNDGAETRGSL